MMGVEFGGMDDGMENGCIFIILIRISVNTYENNVPYSGIREILFAVCRICNVSHLHFPICNVSRSFLRVLCLSSFSIPLPPPIPSAPIELLTRLETVDVRPGKHSTRICGHLNMDEILCTTDWIDRVKITIIIIIIEKKWLAAITAGKHKPLTANPA